MFDDLDATDTQRYLALKDVSYSDALVKQLSLDEKQLYSLSAAISEEWRFEEVVQMLGLSDDDVSAWIKNPFYVVCYHVKQTTDFIVSEDQLTELQAGFLAGVGVAYPDIEKLLGLSDEKLLQWRSLDTENTYDYDVWEVDRAAVFEAARHAVRQLKREAVRYGMPEKKSKPCL